MSYYGPGSLFFLGTEESSPYVPPITEVQCRPGERARTTSNPDVVQRSEYEGCRNIGQFYSIVGSHPRRRTQQESTVLCCPAQMPTQQTDVIAQAHSIRRSVHSIIPNRRFSDWATCVIGQAIPGFIRGGNWAFRAIPLFGALIGIAIEYYRKGFGRRIVGYGAVGYAVGVVVPCMFASMLPET